MFTKFSLLFAAIIFGYACSALNPVLFAEGVNSALKLKKDPRLTQCVSKLTKIYNMDHDTLIQGFDEPLETCKGAYETVLRAFALTFHNTESDETFNTFMAMLSIDAAFSNLESHDDYAAGQNIVRFLINALKAIEKVIIDYPDKVNANKTEMLLGFNDALQINTDSLALLECLTDVSQFNVIYEALMANITAHNPVQSLNEFLIMMKFSPKMSAACQTTIHGVLAFLKPLEKSLIQHPIKSVETLVKNLVSNPFGLLVYVLSAAKDLQMHHDRQAGQVLGSLVLTILQDLH